MKNVKQLFWTWMLLGACSAAAQTNVTPGTTSVQTTREGTVVVPETLPKVTDPLAPGAVPMGADNFSAVAVNSRPMIAERSKLPREVAALIESFQKEAKAYRRKQEELEKKLTGANDTQRALIREQLRQLREQQLERSRELRKEFKERERELSEKMTEYRELLDNVRSAAKDQLRTTREESRTRRGED